MIGPITWSGRSRNNPCRDEPEGFSFRRQPKLEYSDNGQEGRHACRPSFFFACARQSRTNLPGGGAFVFVGVSFENLRMHEAVCDVENPGLSDFVCGGSDFKRRCGEDFGLMHFTDNEGDNLGRPCSPPGQRSRVCIRIRPDIVRTFMRR